MNDSLDISNHDTRQALTDCVRPLRRYALSLSGNLHNADDLLQTTLEKALRSTPPVGDGLLPWLFRVCRNAWIDETRYRGVREGPDADEAAAALAFDGQARIHDTLALAETERWLAMLSSEQREVLELVAVEGYTYEQAAEVLEIPVGTVMSRLSRARTRLAATRNANKEVADE